MIRLAVVVFLMVGLVLGVASAVPAKLPAEGPVSAVDLIDSVRRLEKQVEVLASRPTVYFMNIDTADGGPWKCRDNPDAGPRVSVDAQSVVISCDVKPKG